MGICVEDSGWFNQRLTDNLSSVRHPFSGTIELTFRCNFKCVHCYLRGQSAPEMNTRSVSTLLDELAEAGCLSLALTGGEPLLRPDFKSIHQAAVRRGFFVVLFSNGSLIDDDLADFLAANPPRCVEISLYGGDEESYRSVTGSGKNFNRVIAGLDRLLERGIDVKLKAVLLNPLENQVENMRALGRSRGLDVHLDPGLDLTLKKDKSPWKLRMDPYAAVRLELDDAERLEKLIEYDDEWRRRGTNHPDSSCGAGFSSFNIDPSGLLSPCLMLRRPAVDLRESGFIRGWRQLETTGRPGYADSPCKRCELKHLCSYCPGLAQLGDVPPADGDYYHCHVARARAELIRREVA
jgi:radical SAM protein with 4Fe4S-binding SPASM domain